MKRASIMMIRTKTFAVLSTLGATLLAAWGCSSSTTSPTQTGIDSGTSSATDSGTSLATDSGTSPGTDSGSPAIDAGTDSGNGGGQEAGATGCTITLSGAVSKTLPCTIKAGFDSTNDTSAVPILSVSQIMGAPEASFAFKATGMLAAQTYQWADSADQGSAVYEGGGDGWTASQMNAQGSSSITFTSVDVTGTNGTQTIYAVHGTATASLVAKGTATGTITVDVTF